MSFALGAIFLLFFIAAAIPIGFALGIAGVASLALLVPTNSIMILMSKIVHASAGSYLLLTIPMFVLMAEFLAVGGVATDMLLACNRLLRGIRGGMAMAVILAGTLHAAVTGSSTASAASLSRASFPAMKKAGYKPSFSVGTIAIAGTLAVMIPPSTAFILYGLMTETSIGKLFVGGIFPGLLTAVGYLITIAIVLKMKPDWAPAPGAEARVTEQVTEAKGKGRIWPVTLLIILVLGGLYTGVATPTEISAIGALGALIVSWLTGRMTKAGFTEAVMGTLRITSMILMIIMSAHLFGYFISFSKITDSLLMWISESGMSPTVVMLLIVLIYLLLGMVMDQAAIIILTAPLSTALMVGLGYDPIWWGIIIIKTAEIGLVSPPLGLVTFVVSSSSRVPLNDAFKGCIPFLITELVILGFLLAFPSISLYFVS